MRYGLAFVFVLALCAQDSHFDARSRLVSIPVNVSDAQGHPVEGLTAADFVVTDNGRPQTVFVDSDATGVAPIALVIAVQASGISTPVLEKVRKVGSMVQPLITGTSGCAAVLSFDEGVSWLQDCTNRPEAIEGALRDIRPEGLKRARMLDAAHAAVEKLRVRPDARRVLLLISESRDRGSDYDFALVAANAQMAGVTVYAATYSAFRTAFTSRKPVSAKPSTLPPPPVPDSYKTPSGVPAGKYDPRMVPLEDSMDVSAGLRELVRMGKTDTTRTLAVATGGTILPFLIQKGLENAIERLGLELQTQYMVSFTPDSAERDYHVVTVKVEGASGGFQVRARPGYWPVQ